MHLRAPTFDLELFWRENELSQNKPFRTDKPRAPIELSVDDHWLLEEMKVPSTVEYFSNASYRADVNRQCNDRCEEVLGKRFFSETVDLPPILRIEEVMGSRREIVEGGTPWLEPGFSTIDQVSDRLAEIESWSDAHLRSLMFSTGGQVAKAGPGADGSKLVRTAGSRGLATQATSILGTMNTMYWIIDYPTEMGRFFAVLADIIVRYHRVLAAETGVEHRGYYWLDDNCALYSPSLYEEFCLPGMKRVFDAFAPNPEDYRYQHSDSEMRHLLPLLAALGFHGVNFGPTLPAELIRRNMPDTQIHGEVAPNTVRNKGLEGVVAEVKRDFAAVGADGGLSVTTCGSVSAGTSLESLRGFMWAVDEYCRYD
ncbi:MAG: uroporphyrinogen decarboxylase family protein [Fimbriimonas sp.]|nr:uroporphyrinogen decarboxylase family protein [Fimbriimonas sp.]